MPSDLPILPSSPPDQAPKSTAEKYGGLYYLGIAGLFVLVALITWFGLGVWSLRAVFRDIYILHDPARSEVERVNAAYRLSRDDRVTDRQYWDIALRKDLPPLGRYLMAESLTAGAVRVDPTGYALAVARSESWPGWLRLLMARPMAYDAGPGSRLPPEHLSEILRDAPDPFLRLWAAYTLAALGPSESPHATAGRSALDDAAGSTEPTGELARLLRDALGATDARRIAALDRATLWLRSHHPEAVALWKGWSIEGDQLVRTRTAPPDAASAPAEPSSGRASPSGSG